MKAIIINQPGGVEELTISQVAAPVAGPNEVQIAVKAISINPVDVKSRSGKGVFGRLKDQLPLILGWDISGVVTEVGESVTRFKQGDEVFGMINFPGHARAYAEFVVAPEDHLALKPANISHAEAAASTLAALTAYQALVHQYPVKSGEKVLVHAASGGVGHFAVQIAKHLGAHVTGTSSADNREFVMGLGADAHIDYRSTKLQDAISDVDFVLDTIGGENIDLSLEVIRSGGTLISIPSGLNEEVVQKAKAKNVNGFFFLVSSNGEDMNVIANWLERGVLKPHVSKTYEFDAMAEAHAQVETGRTVGKVVVIL